MRPTILLLLALCLLLTLLPTTEALYRWMPKRQLYNIGKIKREPGSPNWKKQAVTWMGRCGGGDIPVGGYGCGNFEGVGKTIYKCVQGGWLKFHEQCKLKSNIGGDCARNNLPPSKNLWYPGVNGGKAVCMYFGKWY